MYIAAQVVGVLTVVTKDTSFIQQCAQSEFCSRHGFADTCFLDFGRDKIGQTRKTKEKRKKNERKVLTNEKRCCIMLK